MPEVKKFAEENNLDLRITDEWELLKLNVDNYRRVALLEPQAGAKGSRPESQKKDITRSASLERLSCDSRFLAGGASPPRSRRLSLRPAHALIPI
jgi:hypothetical protein